ncbi:high-potential iron-sulfur protein [Pelomonas sp. KK5]|uniref:high-potential iron-sulfur protein n=1 Tax=Pelomonas sp. KK5 TaxID=1855730 RepID=UPI00097C6414|nr:high-potential iron-sulfur protein [Pelomonas sp. KK5]
MQRRTFVIACACPSLALAQAGAHVDEASEQAQGIGYREDTRKVDAKKYPQHRPEQRCSNCNFWQGAKADEWAGCAMFGRKHIANGGWCVAWVSTPAK